MSSSEARLRQQNLLVKTEQPEGPVEDVIVERAKALDVDLIMMTTHGRSGLGRVIFGSVADSVLRETRTVRCCWSESPKIEVRARRSR